MKLLKLRRNRIGLVLSALLFCLVSFADDADLEAPPPAPRPTQVAPPSPPPSVAPRPTPPPAPRRPAPHPVEKSSARKPNEVRAAEKRSMQARMDQSRPETEYGDFRFFRYKTNFLLGVNIVQGAALLLGGQVAYAPFSGTPFYVGPEASFSLFSSSSLLMFSLGGWYEFRIYGAPRLSINVGALGGPSFAGTGSNLGSLSASAFFDACIVQEVNEMVSVRGQFRPGVIGSYFAFQMNFNVSFRFL